MLVGKVFRDASSNSSGIHVCVYSENGINRERFQSEIRVREAGHLEKMQVKTVVCDAALRATSLAASVYLARATSRGVL